ncbi:hypothetical protein FOB58_005715 [Candida parapsilosis]|uniref:Uncharacterized protein n=1 Tax=Candida parapsilosis TaxID=5480 RepID=A0A8X7NHF7_CANPA|nr:hypothetical protein FOB58_005715 [Candida parapsilosis]KAF6042511.1 hypothetical protein FOB59_005693 [Candida parapsilosis]KAF6042956.1 hypothetical protein FOB60_005710 [Candida parapsilosis]
MGAVWSIPVVIWLGLCGSGNEEGQHGSANETASTSYLGSGSSSSLNNTLHLINSPAPSDTPTEDNNWPLIGILTGLAGAFAIVGLIGGYIEYRDRKEKRRKVSRAHTQSQNMQDNSSNEDSAAVDSLRPPEKAHLKLEDTETLVGEEDFEYHALSGVEFAGTKY